VLILAAIIAVAIALAVGYAAGRRQRPRDTDTAMEWRDAPASPVPAPPPVAPAGVREPPPTATGPATDGAIAERARIIRSFEAETAMLRRNVVAREAAVVNLLDLAEDRRRLHGELASSRGETARYRQLVVDLENNAPPPFFGAGAPDDLKLIVGVGPVLERMLQQLGITTYRQIARWSERDIDEFDAKLPEFPGRIRRDAWVTQARELHASKYGAPPSARDR
jgi:predicted flap endonuclease-1-like 5' DNA nuclease